MSALSSGLMTAVTAAAGQALNDVGGVRITRLTQPVSPGDTMFHVERSGGLPEPGRVAIDGVPYFYQTVGDGTLNDVYYTHGGLPKQGAANAHALGAQVTDISGTYSAIDQANQALFVKTATGDDLSVIGRNLGVPRLPSLEDDAQYRELIQVLAYNPRGTLLGLRLVLDTLVGSGQYSITEDLVSSPCQVFVTVPGALFLNNVSQGKAYLEDTATALPQGDSVTTASTDIFVSSARPVSENFLTQCANQPPDQASSGLWSLQLSSKNAASGVSTQTAYGQPYGSATTFSQTPGFYHHASSVTPYTYARLQACVAFPSDNSLSSSDGRCFGGRLSDGVRAIAWGVMQPVESTTANVGLISTSSGAFIAGAATQVSLDMFHVLQLRKYGSSTYALYVDGVLVQTANYTTASTSSAYGADLGALGSSPSCSAQLLSLGCSTKTDFDYLNLRPAAGLTASTTANSATLLFNQSVLQASDTGKTLRISRSAATNSSGGNNNGVYAVNYVGAQQATLTLPSGTAQVASVTPTRITLNKPYILTYPDSLGTQIQLSGSTQGNNGTYTIVRLIDPHLGTSFASYPTSKPRTTNVCEVSSASFVAEQGLQFSLLPQFAAEQNVQFELVDAAAHEVTSSQLLTIVPRAPEILPAVPMALRAANVRTGQVFDTSVPFVALLKDGTFSASPFYISDAVVFLEAYLQGVVAAGVRLNFSFS